MTPKVLGAYKRHGFRIDLGCPERLFSTLVEDSSNRPTSCSGGFTPTDALVFTMMQRVIDPSAIFVIGNSFGLSTFVLADLFPRASVDVIDAECEGLDVKVGSELSRALAKSEFRNVSLTLGYSPQDLGTAMKQEMYNLIFVDGLHTNEQLLKDYYGVVERCAHDHVIYFHDVASCRMFQAWAAVRSDAEARGLEAFEFGFTQMGCAALVGGYGELKEYFRLAANSFCGPYEIGFKDEKFAWATTDRRPFFWELSFGHLERLVRRKVKRVFGRGQ